MHGINPERFRVGTLAQFYQNCHRRPATPGARALLQFLHFKIPADRPEVLVKLYADPLGWRIEQSNAQLGPRWCCLVQSKKQTMRCRSSSYLQAGTPSAPSSGNGLTSTRKKSPGTRKGPAGMIS